MAKLDTSTMLGRLADRHGLQWSRNGGVFGAIAGVPVHVVEVKGEGQLAVLASTASSEAAGRARSALQDHGRLVEWGLAKQAAEEREVVAVKLPVKALAKRGADEAAALVEDVATRVSMVPGARPPAPEGSRVALVNGIPGYLLPHEVEELRRAGELANQTYAATPARYGRGLAFGLAGMAGAAVVWGFVGAYLGIQAWIVAFGAGGAVAWLTVKGSGKGGAAVQVMVAGLTLASVVLGEVLAMMLLIQREFGVLDPVGSVMVYFAGLGEWGADLAFAAGGGLLGGYWGARRVIRPDFLPEVELAGGDDASLLADPA